MKSIIAPIIAIKIVQVALATARDDPASLNTSNLLFLLFASVEGVSSAILVLLIAYRSSLNRIRIPKKAT